MMEKLVLIPYDKYQRMQERTRGPTEDTHDDSSARETSIPKSSVPKKKKKQRVVTPPPPGKRDTHTKTDPFIDWISF